MDPEVNSLLRKNGEELSLNCSFVTEVALWLRYSDLEAFSRNPTDDSFAALAFQLAAITKYLNEVFL